MKKIVMYPFFNWDSSLMHREHMLAKSFSELGSEVFFINNKKDPSHLWRALDIKDEAGIRQVSFFLFPYMKGYLPFMYQINDWLIKKQLIKLEKEINGAHTSFVTNPNWAMAVCSDNKRNKVVYDISDDYTAFTTNDKWKKMIGEYEGRLINQADHIVLTTSTLGYKTKGRNNVHIVSNGVDYTGLTASKKKINKADKKIIGFIGGIFAWVDLDLFERSVKKYPQYEFILVGPTNNIDRVNEINKYKNFTYHGEVRWSEIGGYFASLDLALIPFVSENEYSRLKTVDSNKIYQYTAFGYPVISTSFNQSRGMKDIIKVCDNKEEFIAAIGELINEKDTDIKKKRIDFAKSNTWENKAEQILGYLG